MQLQTFIVNTIYRGGKSEQEETTQWSKAIQMLPPWRLSPGFSMEIHMHTFIPREPVNQLEYRLLLLSSPNFTCFEQLRLLIKPKQFLLVFQSDWH